MTTATPNQHANALAAAMGYPGDGSHANAFFLTTQLLEAARRHRHAAVYGGDAARTSYLHACVIAEELRRRMEKNPMYARFYKRARRTRAGIAAVLRRRG